MRTSDSRRKIVPGIPPIPLIKSVAVFTDKVTPGTAEAIFTAKREPIPEKADITRQRIGFSFLAEKESIIIAETISKEKIM